MSSEDNFIIKNTSSLLCSLCEFWKTVKPFFSKKGNRGEQKIVLFENDKIVNNPNEVSNHFNIFFSKVADKIGIDAVYDSSNHPSIKEILNNRQQVPDFELIR